VPFELLVILDLALLLRLHVDVDRLASDEEGDLSFGVEIDASRFGCCVCAVFDLRGVAELPPNHDTGRLVRPESLNGVVEGLVVVRVL